MTRKYQKDSNVHAIITHFGDAHADDFLSVCLALFLHGDVPVYRRDPTEEELGNDEILVVDVGMRHEPAQGNFDHHQFSRDEEPRCALSLLAEHWGYSGMLSLQKWYSALKFIDVKGPFAYAATNGMSSFPFELRSPIEGALLELFGNQEEVPEGLRRVMAVIGQQVLETASKYQSAVTSVGLLSVDVEVDGIQGILLPSDDTTGIQDYRDTKRPDAAFSVCYDNRGNGWTLYRFNDHPALNFAKLEGLPDIVFAHKGGFIAKTQTRLHADKVKELIRAAIVYVPSWR